MNSATKEMQIAKPQTHAQQDMKRELRIDNSNNKSNFAWGARAVWRWCRAGVTLVSRWGRANCCCGALFFCFIKSTNGTLIHMKHAPPNISNASQCKRRTRGHRSAPAALSAVKMCASFARGAGRQGSRAPTITRQIKEYKEMTVNPKKNKRARAAPHHVAL